MGYVRDLPVAISFIGKAWDDAAVLKIAYAYEQLSHARRAPAYIPSLETARDVAPLYAPAR